ncbi:hypothetical protein EVAR_67097_1 [Eumeta japonica]|uniref:Uncharacterized protein n=1 Tax=Eumeta variegata TaxID=151549 RepID=A0A4C1ZNT7_EUMVA|nr:hypothetical protein EVAR_67097_1 [Eumeta japonica]
MRDCFCHISADITLTRLYVLVAFYLTRPSRLSVPRASRHLNIEQISNLLSEDKKEPFESDDELSIGEHLAEQQNHNSDSKQSETDSEDEAGSSSSEYYLGKDK